MKSTSIPAKIRTTRRPRRIYRPSLSGVMLLVGTLAMLALSACSQTGGSGTVRPDSQQIFRMFLNANGTDIKTMDPAKNQDFYSYFPISLVFPGLLALDPSGNVVPWAATGMPVFSQANNTYTFTVRSGLTWSDGTPIDANTFAYSLNRSLNPCTGSLVTYYMFAVKDASAFSTETCGTNGTSIVGKLQTLIGDSLTVPNNQTLVIKLSAPAPYFLQAMTYPTTYAQPEQLIERFGANDWINHLTENGGFGGNMYKVKVWDHRGNVDLVRNSSFWGTSPKLREIDFKVYKTLQAEYADYQTGRLDVGAAPPAEYKESKQRSDFHEESYLSTAYYQPNWDKPPFNNVLVRQAFDLALNKQVLSDQVNQGSTVATNHIVPEGMYGYDPSLTGPDGSASLAGNPARATQLMQQYASSACGGQLSKCPPVTLFDSNDPAVTTYDQAAVQMWQSAFPGYPIRTQFIDFNTLLTQIYSPNSPQIFGIAWSADYPDPQDWLTLQFGPGSINNTGNVSVPAANALMAQADVDLNPTQRASLYNQAEQLLVDQGAWIPTYQFKTFYNLPPYMHNFQYTALATVALSTWQKIYLTQ
jgi:peptide/nickel transport system substrate-binding protein/oligopeptide transport system substrate-binding protein